MVPSQMIYVATFPLVYCRYRLLYAGGRQLKPSGFERNEETFIRTLATATGPFLHLVLTMKAKKEQAEKTVAQLEDLQWVRSSVTHAH